MADVADVHAADVADMVAIAEYAEDVVEVAVAVTSLAIADAKMAVNLMKLS